MLILDDGAREQLREITSFLRSLEGGDAKQKRLAHELRHDLACKLRYLHNYGCENHQPNGDGGRILDLKATRCRLGKDWAKFSFFFVMERRYVPEGGAIADGLKKAGLPDYTFWFNGGLIYHGGEDDTLAITQGPVAGWSVHT